MIIHDAELRSLVDGWLSDLCEDDFVDVLPLVRRTFGTFSPPERRLIAERLDRSATKEAATDHEVFDLELAGPALATVEAILGHQR